MLTAWLCLFPLLVYLNDWSSFAGGGDDEDYFRLATTPLNSLSDVFEITRFAESSGQPGYAFLLSIVHLFTGSDLLAFKVVNLAWFVLLIPIWYRIGVEMESPSFGRSMALVILLLAPLWWYWIFLLKDMTIVLLQSSFLLGAVQISGSGGRRGWMLVIAATLVVIPFRSALVMVNLVVLSGTIVFLLLRRARRTNSILALGISAVVIVGVLSIASNPERMASLGIADPSRVIGTQEFTASASRYTQLSTPVFPLLYLFSETAGLNLQTWVHFDPASLRGAFAIPWILLVVPFFVIGILWLMRGSQASRGGRVVSRIRSSRLVATPWGCLVLFVLVYMGLSWTVGDTTRWRLSDMPAIAAVATAGWLSLTSRTRMQNLSMWLTFSLVLFALYQLRGV